jgi:hypothetical protein
MTERVHSLQVVLAHDMREDDVARLIDGLRFFRGVVDVKQLTADPASLMAEARADQKWRERLVGLIQLDVKR